jgi:hypothetical protein
MVNNFLEETQFQLANYCSSEQTLGRGFNPSGIFFKHQQRYTGILRIIPDKILRIIEVSVSCKPFPR